MAKIDPERERQRLAEFYSHQLDGELEETATQAYELTEMARDALSAELGKRGLAARLVEQHPAAPPRAAEPGDPPPEAPPIELSPRGDLEHQDLVTISQFRDLPDALFARGSLESAGIECALLDANMVRLDWFISNLLGGVKLLVRREDAANALEILNQPIPENFDVSGVGEYKQPRCPKCQSLEISFQELSPAAYVAAAFSVPIPFRRRAWHCHSCDVEWEDDGLPAETESQA